jgi:4'-phosphopantetheinyl transferase
MKLEMMDVSEIDIKQFSLDSDPAISALKAKAAASGSHVALLSLAGETLARRMIAKEAGVPASSIVINAEPSGKPYAKGLDVFFNISHSGEIAICATDSRPVGADIQRIVGVRDKLLFRVYSAAERKYVYDDPDKSAERFARLWSMKEAYAKREGNGIFGGKIFECRFENGEPAADYGDFSFVFPEAPEGYVIAVCS